MAVRTWSSLPYRTADNLCSDTRGVFVEGGITVAVCGFTRWNWCTPSTWDTSETFRSSSRNPEAKSNEEKRVFREGRSGDLVANPFIADVPGVPQ